MWQNDFTSRLQEWRTLRSDIQNMNEQDALEAINNWWFRVPLVLHYLHPEENIEDWPDPWELLNDNYFCDIARGLGMLYTIYSDQNLRHLACEMIITDQDELIFVHGKEKYTLNMAPGPVVNIPPREGKTNYVIRGEDIKNKLEQFEV